MYFHTGKYILKNEIYFGKLQEVVAKNKETLQAIIGLKVKTKLPIIPIVIHGFPVVYEYVLAASNRMQKLFHGFDFNEVNFRILTANVDDLIKNTRCTPSSINPF